MNTANREVFSRYDIRDVALFLPIQQGNVPYITESDFIMAAKIDDLPRTEICTALSGAPATQDQPGRARQKQPDGRRFGQAHHRGDGAYVAVGH